jgi:hypothetical protein
MRQPSIEGARERPPLAVFDPFQVFMAIVLTKGKSSFLSAAPSQDLISARVFFWRLEKCWIRPKSSLEGAPLKQARESLAVIVDAGAILTNPVGDLPAFDGRVPH